MIAYRDSDGSGVLLTLGCLAASVATELCAEMNEKRWNDGAKSDGAVFYPIPSQHGEAMASKIDILRLLKEVRAQNLEQLLQIGLGVFVPTPTKDEALADFLSGYRGEYAPGTCIGAETPEEIESLKRKFGDRVQYIGDKAFVELG